MDSVGDGAGLGSQASSDGAAGRGRCREREDRGADRRHRAHRACVAMPRRRTRSAGSGRPATLGAAPPADHRAIVTETLKPPEEARSDPRSTRLLGDPLRISHKSVVQAWSAYGTKPWKAESFPFSTDPELAGKVTDICGQHLGVHDHVPESAIARCVDEESQIQALDRTVPILPMHEGSPDGRTSTKATAPRRATGHPARRLQVRQGPQRQDPRLHRPPERPLPPIRPDKTADHILAKANRSTTPSPRT